MRLPAKVVPSRHMVEPQSPLQQVRNDFRIFVGHVPKARDDFVATIGYLFVLLWGALGDLESIIRKDGIAGVGAAANLATVDTVA